MPSLWKATCELPRFAPLDADASCDLVVVGSGIAGLSAAYEAARCGADVMVIDRGGIASGMTARTTAHLATEIDDRYFELIRMVGEDDARLYHESQVAAVNRVEAVCRDEAIDADFARLPAYLVPAERAHIRELEREYEACQTLGVPVEWADEAPCPVLDGARALKFPDQGRFHPLKYCAGLVSAIVERGGRIHGGTAYVNHDEEDDAVLIRTEAGPVIRAGAVLFATNSPVNDHVAIHTKQVPMRTYAMAGRVPRGSVADALVWDTLSAYHYVRLQPGGDGQDWLIVGGGDHRSGTVNDMDQRFAHLEAWTRKHFPAFGEPEYRWSGQVMESDDALPFSGRDGSERIYVHTGDSGMGMTNGVAGAVNFIALYRNEKARFAELFDPARKPKSRSSLVEYAKGQGPVLTNMAEHLGPGEVANVNEIEPGEGAILRRGIAKHAAYRADDGTVIERSAVCTHAGCIVHWNSFEKCWDCPCHGSHFAPNGTVLNGPAVRPLAEVGSDAAAGGKLGATE